jgi:N-formylglutamate amidohydrolase
MGLVRRICKPGLPVYNRKLRPAEIQARIDKYYLPYHHELAQAIEATLKRFGAVWHLNCHSMPSTSVGNHHTGWERADFVLGDRDGTTCDVAFRKVVSRILERMGYSVRINDPYKGVEIVRRYGNPAQGVHSLQLEINRRLYLNEATLKPSPGYERLKQNLGALMAALQAYTNDQLFSAAAD